MNESTPRNTSLLIEYLKSNIGNHQFSIATMANNFSASYKSMRKEFLKETGHTLIEHFNYLKMEEVKRLLCSTQKDLNEIADQVGYNSSCSLIREFKKETGIHPGTIPGDLRLIFIKVNICRLSPPARNNNRPLPDLRRAA